MVDDEPTPENQRLRQHRVVASITGGSPRPHPSDVATGCVVVPISLVTIATFVMVSLKTSLIGPRAAPYERTPMDGLGVYYPYALPGIVVALRVYSGIGLTLSLIVFFASHLMPVLRR